MNLKGLFIVVLLGILGFSAYRVYERYKPNEKPLSEEFGACEMCGKTVEYGENGLKAPGDRFSNFGTVIIHYDCIDKRTESNIETATWERENSVGGGIMEPEYQFEKVPTDYGYN